MSVIKNMAANALISILPDATPEDRAEALMLALVQAYEADDGDAVAALLQLAGADPKDNQESTS